MSEELNNVMSEVESTAKNAGADIVTGLQDGLQNSAAQSINSAVDTALGSTLGGFVTISGSDINMGDVKNLGRGIVGFVDDPGTSLANIGSSITNFNPNDLLSNIDVSATGIAGMALDLLGLGNMTTNKITNTTTTEWQEPIKRAAVGAVTLTGDAVSAIALDSGGTAYYSSPAVTISGDGSSATATAQVNAAGNITGFTITAGGSGYSTASAAVPIPDTSGMIEITKTVQSTVSTSSSLVSLILSLTGLGLRGITGSTNIMNMVPNAGGVISASAILDGTVTNVTSIFTDTLDYDLTTYVGAIVEDGLDVFTGKIKLPVLDQSAVIGAVTSIPSKLIDTVKRDVNDLVATVQDVKEAIERVEDNIDEVTNAVESAVTVGNIQRIVAGTALDSDDVSTGGAGLIVNNLTVDNSQSAFGEAYDIGSNQNKFDYISSIEELRSDIVALDLRDITTVVVHWTDTFINQDIGSEEIDAQQKQLGHDGIQYHYVIRKNGIVQRGAIQKTKHTGTDHDNYSIAVAFVGGFNCPTETKDVDRYRNVRSLTRAQFNSFEEICRSVYFRNPGIQIIGHNDVASDQIDPGFDVKDYVNDIFGKESIFKDEVITPDNINIASIV
jgi:hypothetical protein